MSLSFINAFDIFTDCYVYGSIAYVLVLIAILLVCSFLATVDEHRGCEPDFYQQVKELLDPSIETFLDSQDLNYISVSSTC